MTNSKTFRRRRLRSPEIDGAQEPRMTYYPVPTAVRSQGLRRMTRLLFLLLSIVTLTRFGVAMNRSEANPRGPIALTQAALAIACLVALAVDYFHTP